MITKMEPPSPCTQRKKTSMLRLVARPQSSEPAVKTAYPQMNNVRGLMVSAMRPISIIAPQLNRR